MAMTPDEKLVLLSAADLEPAIDGEERAEILADSLTVDENGLWPSDDDYTPTYDLNQAAAFIFAIKAARVANGYDFSVEQKSFSRSQLIDHFLTMQKYFTKKSQGSLGYIEFPFPGYRWH